MNKIAVALQEPDTSATLATLDAMKALIVYAEIRLDLMEPFDTKRDIERLVRTSPVPMIFTCRPVREGGRFDGDETQRLSMLQQAADAGAAYIDIEVDSLHEVADWDLGTTGIIASQHDFDRMPDDLLARYEFLRNKCDVVKLVGTANDVGDNRAIFELLRYAGSPVIAMAMGPAGVASRVLAPMFSVCLLTYAAADDINTTAAGQLTVNAMHEIGVDRIDPAIGYGIGVSGRWAIGNDTIDVPSREIAALVDRPA